VSSWPARHAQAAAAPGLPDIYVEHAKPAQMLAECGLDAAGIEASVKARMAKLGL
jgi:1-deoxy-D-xylulose-5-phosphate synthase